MLPIVDVSKTVVCGAAKFFPFGSLSLWAGLYRAWADLITRAAKNRYGALFAASLTALLAVSGAHAASPQNEQEKACRGDAMHFCSAEIPNKDKISACMKQHVSELSPPCRAMFKEGDHSSGNSGGGRQRLLGTAIAVAFGAISGSGSEGRGVG